MNKEQCGGRVISGNDGDIIQREEQRPPVILFNLGVETTSNSHYRKPILPTLVSFKPDLSI